MKKIVIWYLAFGVSGLSLSALESPIHVVGGQRQKLFLLQKELVNIIAWQAPSDPTDIVAYGIYRDIQLTELVATVPATSPLICQDNNRTPGVTYTYYVVSEDDMGDVSLPVIVTIDPCENCVAGISVHIG